MYTPSLRLIFSSSDFSSSSQLLPSPIFHLPSFSGILLSRLCFSPQEATQADISSLLVLRDHAASDAKTQDADALLDTMAARTLAMLRKASELCHHIEYLVGFLGG